MVAAVVGLLSLNACVDDAVSPNVDAIRAAKAKQLESVAAYNNAMAEAELIRANAEKALNDANIEYRKAETAAKETEAENAAWLLENAKAEYAMRLDAIKANAEAEVAAAKLAALAAQKLLTDYADQEIQRLFDLYKTPNDKVITLSGQLITESAKVAGLKAGVVTAEAVVKQTVVTETHNINKFKATKAALEKLGNDKDALEVQSKTLEAELKGLEDQLANLDEPRIEAQEALDAGKAQTKVTYDLSEGEYVTTSSLETVKAVAWIKNEVPSYITVVQEKEDVYSLLQSGVLRARTYFTDQVKAEQNILGKQKVTNPATPATGLYLNLDNAETALATARTDLAAAEATGSGITQDQIDAMKDNITRNLEPAVETAKEAIATQLEVIAEKDAKLTAYEDAIATFAGANKTAYDAAIANIATLQAAYDKEDAAYQLVADEYDTKDATKAAIDRLAGGLSDLNTEIAQLDKDIADSEETIANMTDVADAQALLDILEAEIKQIEVEIDVQKALAAKAKAALDEALKA